MPDESASTPKRDFGQEVTDNIIRMLEQGTAPWQKPWEAGKLEIPSNPTTEKPYRGGNAIHLMAVAANKGYEDPRWLTYKQAAEQGWQVQKGEKGTQIEYWEFPDSAASDKTREKGKPGERSDPEGRGDEQQRIVHRVYTVFNAQQVDGVPPHQPQQRAEFEAIEAGNNILKNSGATIKHDQNDRAFNNRRTDRIHLPAQAAFKTAGAYYGTALHELAHWSGHPSRLNRSTLNESYRFGDTNYAQEELRAELASVFLAAERGIPHDPEQHAAYVGSWISALRNDKNEIFRAAKDANRAADFLLSLEREKSIAEEELASESGTAITIEAAREATAGFAREAEDLRRAESAATDHAIDTAAEQTDQNAPRAVPSKLGLESKSRETTRHTAHYEAESGTVNIHDRHTVTDHRSVIDDSAAKAAQRGPMQVQSLRSSFADAQAISKETMGGKAKTYVAQTDSGIYRGEIIGHTELHVLQRVNGESAVAHMKHLLSHIPDPGSSVLIKYSGDGGRVNDLQARSRSKELSR